MKAISFLQSLPVFFLSFLTGIYLHAQTTPDLQAIAVDGQITLRVKNTAVLDTLFYVDTDNKVILDFYFGPDDSRNGTYSANPVAQSFGEQHLSFASIPYTTGDTLSFSVMETMPDNTAREYLFIEGVYVRSAGGLIDVCPVSLECIGTWWNFFIRFNPSDIQIDLTTLANTTVYIYSPGSSINGYYQPGGVSFSKNALVFKSLPCESVLSGEIIIMINGLTCIFQNGQLVSNDTSCSPWGDFYSDNKPCAPYFENCPEEIMELLSDNKYTLPCRQWIDKNNCNTGVLINRTGKVAIGTSGFSSSFLTVKNGILADKVKVQTCSAGSWCDYVFGDRYALLSLEETDAYIRANRHLPGIPPGSVIEAEGSFELGEITKMHQEKIEEIFLHLIALEQDVATLEAGLAFLELLGKMNVR